VTSEPVSAVGGIAANGSAIRAAGKRLLRLLHLCLSGGRGVALALLLALTLLRGLDPAPVELVRLKTFDFMQTLLPPSDAPHIVPIVEIDEASLKSIGQWPWSRRTIALMVEKLTRMGAVVVGFDVVFAEPDRLSPGKLADEIDGLDGATRERLRELPDNDALLALMLKRSRVVLGRFGEVGRPGQELPPVARKMRAARVWGKVSADPMQRAPLIGALTTNLPQLEHAAAGIGFLSLRPSQDNVVRRVEAFGRYRDMILPTLSVEMLRVATGKKSIVLRADGHGLSSVAVAGVKVPIDRHGRMWLRALRRDPARYISAADVLNDRVDPARVKGRLILVGATAPGLQDLRSTPLVNNLPGVEVHAHLIENIISQKHLVRDHESLIMEVLIFASLGLAMIIFLPVVGARWTLLALLVIGAGLIGGALYFLREHLLLLDPSFALISTAVIYIYLSYASYVSEERNRLFIREAFSQYLAPAQVELLTSNPDSLKLGGETREMTFLFCDVRGFTSISEGFKDDPQALTSLINRFLTPMTDEIMARQGTVDKYMGDCVMAFWNAPLDDSEHALHGCQSALAMLRSLDRLNEELAEEARAAGDDAKALRMGIGLNTGECVVGNVGSEQRFDYSVLGDPVNLASRLEGQSKNYGVDIVIGEDTAAAIDGFALVELDLIAVKGKAEAARIFALMGDAEFATTADFQNLQADSGAFLTAYREQDWSGARTALAKMRDSGFDLSGYCDLFEERIAFFEADPPGPDWDGVFVAESK
jgi:adenylate cyclase